MSGNWKANVGSAILEEIPVNERSKFMIFLYREHTSATK